MKVSKIKDIFTPVKNINSIKKDMNTSLGSIQNQYNITNFNDTLNNKSMLFNNSSAAKDLIQDKNKKINIKLPKNVLKKLSAGTED